MATKASKTVVNAVKVLQLMASNARELRTPAALAKASGGELSTDQVEGILLAYEEAGVVQKRSVDGVGAFYLLGAVHVSLAAAELEGLLSDAAQLHTILNQTSRLAALQNILNVKG